ncbi:MAG: Flp family type IVb pilin [Bryobacteraceae bacterium]
MGDCDGQDMVEYALLAGIIAVGAIVALTGFQSVITNVWNTVSQDLSGAG